MRPGVRVDSDSYPESKPRVHHPGFGPNITAWRNILLEWRPWKKNKPLSESTVGNMVGQVCGLLKRAHNDGMIGRVPVVKIPKTAPVTSPTRQDLLTVEEVAEMISAMRDGHRAPRDKSGKRKPGAKDTRPVLISPG